MNDSENKECRLRGKLSATDWLSDVTFAGDTEIVQVVFKNTRSAFFRNSDRLPIKNGDWVAVEASPGTDIGKICMTGPLVRLQMKKGNVTDNTEIKRVLRLASESDMEKFAQARAREEDTMIRSRQIAAELNLNMKIGDVEYQGDGAKAIFYYIADERVDFRKLIRILADTFKVRIEMKQIGARQEAGRIGGIGPCGRPLCCSSWMTRFISVGTGAARIQDLSMNPQKLAGQCGKLKCCINFETDAYAEASRRLPHKDAVLQTLDQDYYWFKVDILSGKVTYSTDKKMAVNLTTISAERALEIIELNKQGHKVESLSDVTEVIETTKEYVELVGQDSLTRFDKAKKKRKKKGKDNSGNKDRENQKSKDHQNRDQLHSRMSKDNGKDSRKTKDNRRQKGDEKVNQKSREEQKSNENLNRKDEQTQKPSGHKNRRPKPRRQDHQE